jgi:hypothetical protein
VALSVVLPAQASATGTPTGTTSTSTTGSTSTTSATSLGTPPAGTPAPPGSTSAPVTPSAPATPPAAAAAKVTLYLPDAFFVQRQPVTVPGRSFHVGGIVRPYVPGQWVLVRGFLGGHLIKSEKLRVRPSPNGTYGHFTAALSSPGVGTITVTVLHSATAQLRHFRVQRRLSVLDESVGFGSTGRFVELIQQRLAALHFYVPQTGVFDEGTGLAIDAYHRLLHWGTSQSLDGRTISFLLDGLGAFKVRFPGQGRHAEGDLSLQLLALVNGSQVYRIYPISSGKPSTPTILGDFRVYSKVAGYLPDGMYYSNFFIRGFAIHGYDPAPDYPASHGCMRLPIVDAISVYDWLNLGDWVDVYY